MYVSLGRKCFELLPPQQGDIEAEFFLMSPLHSLAGSSDGAIFGHACAANAVAIAAMDIDQGDGVGGAFEGRLGKKRRAVSRLVQSGSNPVFFSPM